MSPFLLFDLLDLSILITTGLRNIAIPDMNIVADTYQERGPPVASGISEYTYQTVYFELIVKSRKVDL